MSKAIKKQNRNERKSSANNRFKEEGNHPPKQSKRVKVVENSLVNLFLNSSTPDQMRSRHYPIQALLGLAGLALIFYSFRVPAAFFAGALLLVLRHQWRKKTDAAAVQYQKAVTALKKKQYRQCIDLLDQLANEKNAPPYLGLIKASCLLEMNQTDDAYGVYRSTFMTTPAATWTAQAFWAAQENALMLALERNDLELAEVLVEQMNASNQDRPDAARLKRHFEQLKRNL